MPSTARWTLSNIVFWDGYLNYALVTLLVLYFTQQFNMPLMAAYHLYGLFLTTLYMLPLAAGYLSEKYWGPDFSLVNGHLVTIVGCLLMAYATKPSLGINGLALICLGIGLIKANSNALVKSLYPNDSTNQERTYTWLYAAMNLGAILGPLAFGISSTNHEWNAAFISTALFFAFSLFVYYFRKKDFPYNSSFSLAIYKKLLFLFGAITCVLISLYYLARFQSLYDAFVVIILLMACRILFSNPRPEKNVIAIMSLFYLLIVLFFIAEFQIGSTLVIFSNSSLKEIEIFGLHIPPTSCSALLPLFVILGAFLITPLISPVRHATLLPKLLYRAALGLLFGCFGFFLFFISATLSLHAALGYALICLTLGYLFLGCAEIFIVPTALTATGHFICQSRQASFMGIFYLAVSISGYLSEKLSSYLHSFINSTQAKIVIINHYKTFFLSISSIMLIVSLGLIGGVFIFLKKYAHQPPT